MSVFIRKPISENIIVTPLTPALLPSGEGAYCDAFCITRSGNFSAIVTTNTAPSQPGDALSAGTKSLRAHAIVLRIDRDPKIPIYHPNSKKDLFPAPISLFFSPWKSTGLKNIRRWERVLTALTISRETIHLIEVHQFTMPRRGERDFCTERSTQFRRPVNGSGSPCSVVYWTGPGKCSV